MAESKTTDLCPYFEEKVDMVLFGVSYFIRGTDEQIWQGLSRPMLPKSENFGRLSISFYVR
jgi:hypothetical protein